MSKNDINSWGASSDDDSFGVYTVIFDAEDFQVSIDSASVNFSIRFSISSIERCGKNRS